MNQPTWNDVTIYEQSDRARIPEVWDIRGPGITITVTRHQNHGPDAWVLFCEEAGIRFGERLKAREIEAAKREALERVSARLTQLAVVVARMRGILPQGTSPP